ncbi:flagellar motor switch phosphatase FliY [Cytobacillus purgationiresistens]|uniref:Flagellar motor switch protein FliN/FliY n=1 Tax=Cytobacillus purgationiresistens TaxID=863449 RepID=A0ABU0AG37_9BACI|nr:flagellar motor switch phosphatase FliY [Cytobacillus purgationiresistens]MDQ0270219.1 flagellar motor switch protein FliN/FliY [Cytobacillus purgationiresistens]
MSNDMLSQDEIDALLKGSDDSDDDISFDTNELDTHGFLSPMEEDALGEIGNISFGSSTTALSTLLNQKVEITTPSVSIIQYSELAEEFPHPYVAIKVNYTEGFRGTNILVINQSDAVIIADLMLGGDGTNPAAEMDEIHLSAVQEAMNQMMGSAATSMSTIFGKRVDISPPTIDLINIPSGEGKETIPNEDSLVKISFRITIGSLIDSNIMQLLPLKFAKELVSELLNPAVEDNQMESPVGNQPFNQSSEKLDHLLDNEFPTITEDKLGYPHNESSNNNVGLPNPAQLNQHEPQIIGSASYGQEQPTIQPAMFSEFEPMQVKAPETKNLDMLLDIPLQLTVELGRTKRSVKEILELSAGSIIELDKLAGEPVDILINSHLIAQGEVVVIDENFGVRVTSIISPTDRIKKLR